MSASRESRRSFSGGLSERIPFTFQEEIEKTSRLYNRGPDSTDCHVQSITSNSSAFFTGCVLHFRGQLTQQPICDDGGNVLLWNGEIFGGHEVKRSENDGAVLLAKLSACDDVPSLLNTIAIIQGPWAFIYWQESVKKLWFGRDIFGRRCLLWNNTFSENQLIISSVRVQLHDMSEVPATGMYCADYKDSANSLAITKYPWQYTSLTGTRVVPNESYAVNEAGDNAAIVSGHGGDNGAIISGQYGVWPGIQEFNRTLPNDKSCANLEVSDTKIDSEIKPSATVNCQTHSKSRDSKIDSDNGCQLLQQCATERMKQLSEQLVEILGQAVKVRVEALPDICGVCDHNHIELGKCESGIHDKGKCETGDSEMGKCETGAHYKGTCETSAHDKRKCETGAYNQLLDPAKHTVDEVTNRGCGHSRIAILFSGGVDCMVLAALADRFVPPSESVDLLNVAFEQIRLQPAKGKTKTGCSSTTDPYNVPDRVTGRKGLEELNPNRKWNFVEINISIDELQRVRSDHVHDLVYPLNTVLDDSIGCAIWCAARGIGTLKGQPYTSPARVVLVGMGADEQFAGYSRHRGRFTQEGWSGLIDEIDMEIKRISTRNLGRDDRVISDHGREARFPYLDENVVSFLNSLRIDEKVDLSLPRGVGEKMLLRLTAQRLGLTGAAVLPKRALQFGSRIAKAENRKEKAGDVCARLTDL